MAISERACERIRVLNETSLSQLELLLLRDMSIQRRKEGIALTERMEVRYRREGRYFDEILEGDVP